MEKSLELVDFSQAYIRFLIIQKNRDGNWLYLIIRDIPVVRVRGSSADDRVEYLESF